MGRSDAEHHLCGLYAVVSRRPAWPCGLERSGSASSPLDMANRHRQRPLRVFCNSFPEFGVAV